ncbi:hypothetical protein ACFQXB_06070 [Plastorhodobacter daqingensis]|uniref:Uncharacterized protein n=1 Tax=Plastorhodobacter daqingensis TaxID=1387281 RepID=A0ABW2UKF4_9RHOB
MLHQIKTILLRSPQMLLADTVGVLSLGLMLIAVLHLPDLI